MIIVCNIENIPLKEVKKISFYNNDFKKKFKYSLKYSTTVMDSINEKGYYKKNGVKIYFKNDQITIK